MDLSLAEGFRVVECIEADVDGVRSPAELRWIKEGSSFRSVGVRSGQSTLPCVSNSQVRCLPGSKSCLRWVFRQW